MVFLAFAPNRYWAQRVAMMLNLTILQQKKKKKNAWADDEDEEAKKAEEEAKKAEEEAAAPAATEADDDWGVSTSKKKKGKKGKAEPDPVPPPEPEKDTAADLAASGTLDANAEDEWGGFTSAKSKKKDKKDKKGKVREYFLISCISMLEGSHHIERCAAFFSNATRDSKYVFPFWNCRTDGFVLLDRSSHTHEKCVRELHGCSLSAASGKGGSALWLARAQTSAISRPARQPARDPPFQARAHVPVALTVTISC